MIDAGATLETARSRVRRARKTGGRLLVSGLGFSAAYFFDPDHGRERRQRALALIGHLRRSAATESAPGEPAVPPLPDAAGETRGPFKRAANGVGAPGRR
jgi:hypothetical protein